MCYIYTPLWLCACDAAVCVLARMRVCVCWAASKQKPGTACSAPHLQAHLHVINFPPVHLLPQNAAEFNRRTDSAWKQTCILPLPPLTLSAFPKDTKNKNLQTPSDKIATAICTILVLLLACFGHCTAPRGGSSWGWGGEDVYSLAALSCSGKAL